MGRPKTPLISRREVVRHALAIVDADGMDALNMRRLGAELNVKGASLYHHFANKDEILVAVGRAVLREIELPPADGDVFEWLVAGNLAQRRVLLRHPNVIPLLSRGYLRISSLPTYHDTVRRLVAAGLSEADATDVLQAMEAFTVGDVVVSLMPEAPSDDVVDQVRAAPSDAAATDNVQRFERNVRALLGSWITDARRSAAPKKAVPHKAAPQKPRDGYASRAR